MSGLVHPDQNARDATQNSLCRAVNRRRGCCACRAICRRRARFSRTRPSRERKPLTNQPRKCRSETIIAGIISEKSESSFAPSHSFCRCTTFWRGTTTERDRGRISLQSGQTSNPSHQCCQIGTVLFIHRLELQSQSAAGLHVPHNSVGANLALLNKKMKTRRRANALWSGGLNE
jgi:hypothetical protein